MATVSPLKDIDDKFCLCSICLEQLKEPKLMPCLHRYCKDCLDSIIRGSHDVIRCPECREEVQIPPNGVDGFKTDFYSKSLVEYVKIQQSLKSDEVRECYSCSKHLKVAAYCFKCNDFLCKDCYNFHLTNKIVKDHQQHTLSLVDIELKNITVARLASMRDAPRCYVHPEKISELFCETCKSLPVCLACMLGEHRGHNLHEVKTLAKLKREDLSQKLKTLEMNKNDKQLFDARQMQEKLKLNVNIEKEKLTKIHNEKTEEIMTNIRDTEQRQEQVKTEKQNTEKQMSQYLQKEMEKEIAGIKKKYEEIIKAWKSEISKTFEAKERYLIKVLTNFYEKLERFDRDKKELLESIEKQLDENFKMILKISEHFDNIGKRFETLNVTAFSILASENDWSAVQCIPDMCTAATNLLEDLKRDFPELTSLTDVTVNYKQFSLGQTSSSEISETAESKLTIIDADHYFTGITSSGDGNIVLSGGRRGRKVPLIIVIDVNGKIIKQKAVNGEIDTPWHFCDFLSQKVVTACSPNKIVLYDVRDGSHIERNINDIINTWPKDRHVSCVATDPVNNHILVGGYNSRDVYLFDDQLNYLHILTLPERIKWPRDITVSDGHLLVCDHDGKKAYVTSMEGLKSDVVDEFVTPNLVEGDWRPWSVCTGTNGLVYVLSCGSQRYLTQYSHDGRQIVATRKMDDRAIAVAAIETSQGEKLVVAHSSKTVCLYGFLNKA